MKEPFITILDDGKNIYELIGLENAQLNDIYALKVIYKDDEKIRLNFIKLNKHQQ